MIWLSFKRWNSAHGSVFTRERLYYQGKWTPLVRVRFRHLRTNLEVMRASGPPREEA